MNDVSFSENLSDGYSFSVFNVYQPKGRNETLNRFIGNNLRPVIVSEGSELVLGDSLGPLIGTMLKDRNLDAYVYGTLNFPITAREVEYAANYIKLLHPDCFYIAVDAAVGNDDDVGLIKAVNKGIKPGLGVDKRLGVIGDCGIIGVVAGKSAGNYSLFNLTRLNLIYKMAEKIAAGIYDYVCGYKNDISAGA